MLLTFIKHFNWANGVHSNNNELKSKIGIGKQDEHKFKKLDDEGKKWESGYKL